MGFPDPGLPEVVEGSATGGFPTDFAFVKQVELALERVAGFGRPAGKGANDPVLTRQPNGKKARLPLSSQMEQNTFILKWLAQGASLADRANRKDKRDDSGGKNV